MRTITVLLLAALAPCLGRADSPGDSVVKIFVDRRAADYVQPWQMQQQESVSGSGFLIDENRILTNAHVVADDINIQVRKPGDADISRRNLSS